MREVETVKAVVALTGFVWLLAPLVTGGWLRAAPRSRRVWDAGLAALGLFGALCWTNLGQLNFPGFGHPSETFHYYMGAKYFPELGYSRLYRCVALADAAVDGDERVRKRRIRNLQTKRLENGAGALDRPGECTSHFTPERWVAFQRDLAWFRDKPTPQSWRRMQTDHGYNATPVWGLFGGALAGTSPARDGQILALRLPDPVLLLLGFGAVTWTFGWRTLCVALLFFGTNYPSQFGWVGGGVLRQLELSAVLIGVCLLARRRPGTGGACFALATLVRIYPGVALAGPGLQVAGRWLRERRIRLGREVRRFAGGGLIAAALLLAAAAASTGAGSWSDFSENSRALLDAPVRNHTGLRSFLAWHPQRTTRDLLDRSLDDPFQPWKQARRATFAERRPLFVALAAGFVALLALAVQRQPLWVAAILGVGLIPVTTELTGYYSAILVVFALLWSRAPAVGVALVGLSAAGWGLVEVFHFFDSISSWIGLAAAIFAVFATLATWWAGPVSDPTPSTVATPGEVEPPGSDG
jgi:hypothetical protein